VILTPEERAAIEAQAVEEYPHEACGVILASGAERTLMRCRNDQDELHARDPARHPRDARTAYHIADSDRLRMLRFEDKGFVPVVIYHSHVDAGAYFSETDTRQALLQGEPMYPDTTYVVVSVRNRQVDAIAGFRWSPTGRRFAEIDLGAPGTDR
jgi:[CysO sulfur-carrier protein]-S-L-cysteine hydrolase